MLSFSSWLASNVVALYERTVFTLFVTFDRSHDVVKVDFSLGTAAPALQIHGESETGMSVEKVYDECLESFEGVRVLSMCVFNARGVKPLAVLRTLSSGGDGGLSTELMWTSRHQEVVEIWEAISHRIITS